jgi:dolichyl-phosphate-mannose-protein mannosyltransferase
MNKTLLLFVAVIVLAFGLRFYDLSYPEFKWMDEARHVPAATNYSQNGQFETDNWEHPPLRHLMLYGFLQSFGDNPYGWRMRNVLFGSLAAGLTFLFALQVSGSRRAGLLAGVLLAIDPLHIMLSRYTYEEIYGTGLFLLSVVLYLKHDRRSGMLVLSALVMGCALAVKWYVLPGWLLLWLFTLKENDNYRDPGRAAFITATWLLLPLSVFVLSYLPWFGRGYTLPEFAEFITNAYYSLQADRAQHYDQSFFFLDRIDAKKWFLSPLLVGQGTLLEGGKGEFALFCNNLPVWILTLPAMAGLALLSFKRRSLTLALPLLLFCGTYLLYLAVNRPVFLYSASTLLPFAFTAIAICINLLAERFSVRLYYVTAAALLLWSLYLYPFVTAKKVPMTLYGYLLKGSPVRVQ